MRIENVILEGLRRSKPAISRSTTRSQAREQQIKDAEIGPISHSEDTATDDEHEPTQHDARRRSSIIEEISRQASVLWHDSEVTEGEEGITTDDEGDELLVEQNGHPKKA